MKPKKKAEAGTDLVVAVGAAVGVVAVGVAILCNETSS